MSLLWLETSTSEIKIGILGIPSILFIVILSWRSLILLNLNYLLPFIKSPFVMPIIRTILILSMTLYFFDQTQLK